MPERTDIVIIGGGIAGVALACELTQRAMRVVLLEAGELASEATGNGFAWLNATSKHDDEAYHRLNAQGMARWTELASLFGAETLGIRRGGSLFWAGDDDTTEQNALRQRAARLQARSYPVTLLSAREIAALEPRLAWPIGGGDALGLFAPSDGWLDTKRAVTFMAQQANGYGNETQPIIRTHSPAFAFTRETGGRFATVRTPQDVISASHCVLASGLAIPALVAQLTGNPDDAKRFPLHNVPGLLVETAANTAPGLVGRILYPPDAGGLHLRPTSQGGVLLGADDTDALLSPGLPASPELAARLLYRAASFWPDLAPLAAAPSGPTTWMARVCCRPVPADERPIVGALPGVPGVSVLVTHSGVTLGPLLARLLADEIITGRASPALAPYQLSRFNRF